LSIAAEVGIPPYFALSIALEENQSLDPMAVNINNDGSLDLGIMQLNSGWFNGDWADPETNIRAGCRHIKALMYMPGINTFWQVAVCYNAGTKWHIDRISPPAQSIEYGVRVMVRWNEITNGRARVLLETIR